MDSGTDTWVIVLAAFGGGTVGAMIQPALTYLFGRLRAGEEQRKRTERQLRRMVESWLRHGSSVTTAALIVRAMRQNRQPITDDSRIRLMLSREDAGYWIPKKIKDVDLRLKGDRYYDGVWKLGQMIWDPNFNEDEMTDLMKNLGNLQGEIVDRMDELEFPEVDQ